MRSRDIVEGEDSEAKIEEEVRAKGDEGPERELRAGVSLWFFLNWCMHGGRTYNGDDFGLD